MTSVAIVGCGTIGTALAQAIARDHGQAAQVIALVDPNRAHALRLQAQLTPRPTICILSDAIRRCRLIVEAASATVSSRVARLALAADRDVLIMSTGGLLLGPSTWRAKARRSRGRLLVPSGGLCGLDGAKAMAVGTIRRIRLTTRKPPKGLSTAPFVLARRLRLDRLRRPRLLFEGSPRQAVTAFPQNTNVAATLALACVGAIQPVPDVIVRVIADPTTTLNSHEVEIDGDAGRLRSRLESRPAVTNPKTSEMAVRSAMATIRQYFEPVRIGT